MSRITTNCDQITAVFRYFIIRYFSYSITIDISENLISTQPLIDSNVLSLMKGLNDIETNLQLIYEGGSYNDSINPNGTFK